MKTTKRLFYLVAASTIIYVVTMLLIEARGFANSIS